VDFSVVHDLPGSRAAVTALLCDPAFHTSLELPDLGQPEVVEVSTAGSEQLLRLRYEYIGQIDGVARKLLGNRRLTWLQDLRFDSSTFRGGLTFAAEADPKRLHGDATVALLEGATPDTTRRTIKGALHVRVPLIGGNAERRIVPGLVQRLDVEAAALTRALTR